MRIHRIATALAALLLALSPGAMHAQDDDDAHQPGLQELRETEQRPLDRLMSARDELQLTDGQVTRLRQIATRLEETNRPLRRQLVQEYARWREERRQELERMTPAERRAEMRRLQGMGGRPPVPEPLRPLAMRIRGNVRQAVQEAGVVLTPAQRQRARQLVRERAAERRERMGPRGRWGGGRLHGGRP